MFALTLTQVTHPDPMAISGDAGVIWGEILPLKPGEVFASIKPFQALPSRQPLAFTAAALPSVPGKHLSFSDISSPSINR